MAGEYFAESFAAYMIDPAALEGVDKNGFDMVERVLKLRRVRLAQ